jgi:hypothetical protein
MIVLSSVFLRVFVLTRNAVAPLTRIMQVGQLSITARFFAAKQPHPGRTPMFLRDKIEAAITAAQGDNKAAAMNVCVLLEQEVGLSGNGWFDGDEELFAVLADDGIDAGATDAQSST